VSRGSRRRAGYRSGETLNGLDPLPQVMDYAARGNKKGRMSAGHYRRTPAVGSG
jgi:hypothetical protein